MYNDGNINRNGYEKIMAIIMADGIGVMASQPGLTHQCLAA